MAGMRNETAEKVADLLFATSVTLKLHGRPRMLPGDAWRPEAINRAGKACRPTHHKAVKWSLPGALKADAKELSYGRYIVRLAAEAILDATDEFNGREATAIEELDGSIYDTRAVIRLCRKASKRTERQRLAA